MSFSFGSNIGGQSSFGAAAAKPFSFSGPGTATTNTGFGGFGTTVTTAATGFGGFGGATSTVTPFGGLGTTTTTTTPSLFGGSAFGATAAKPGFGTTGFGTNTGFGTSGGFGTAAPAFGGTASSFGTAPAFGTGAAPAFGTSTAPAFGTGGAAAPAFGTGTSFGTSFGVKPAAGAFGGFGAGLGTGLGTFGQQPQQLQVQQQPQPQGPANADEALMMAVSKCTVFGDERDRILTEWNLLQAKWGTGKAYYSSNAQPLDLNEQNPLCVFKAIGYSRLGGREDKDGHVSLLFNKPEQDIKNNQQSLVTSLFGLLGNKPNLAVNVESVKAVSDNKTQVIIFVVDNNASGSHVLASELAAFLNGPSPKAALSGAGCATITAVTRPSQHVLTQYLQTAPPGMDLRWKQAQTDNPDPENYIPVPIIGFTEIKFRAQCQAEQASLQAHWLKRASEQLSELRTRRATAAARLANLTARFYAHRHTLLQVLGNQEVRVRVGVTLSPDEEAARTRVHELVTQLAAPPLYSGRLNELQCAVRLQRSASAGTTQERYQLDPECAEDVKQFLWLQQRGTAHLLDTARRDLRDLTIIADGMAAIART